MNPLKINEALVQFFNEDIGDGDRSSLYLFEKDHRSRATIRAKESGVVAGLILLPAGFSLLDETSSVTLLKSDGDSVTAGEAVAEIEATSIALLSGERVMLNLLQRLSGIATATKRAVDLTGGQTRITDTRKTTPGLRMFEKYAVRCGGGINHRNGLYDAVMLKDNHIAAAGSITAAVEKVRRSLGHMIKLEVEVESLEQLKEAVSLQVDCLLIDNQTPETIRHWLTYVPETILTEASGGLTAETISVYAESGVHYLSLGALTHSAPSMDFSLNIAHSIKEVQHQ